MSSTVWMVSRRRIVFILPWGSKFKMLYCKKLAVFALPIAVLVALLAPVQAKTRKGDKLMSQGHTAELQKQYDQALDFYEQALSEDPADTSYQLAMRRVRFQ